MRCALVNLNTALVDNIIVADPSVDTEPPGYKLVALPTDSEVGIGWVYIPATNSFVKAG